MIFAGNISHPETEYQNSMVPICIPQALNIPCPYSTLIELLMSEELACGAWVDHGLFLRSRGSRHSFGNLSDRPTVAIDVFWTGICFGEVAG